MDENEFSFITPKTLRNNIVESVKFAAFLWILAQRIEKEYQDETLRTIILYNIAVIEALLLFRIKREKIKFEDVEYKYTATLPGDFKKQGRDLIVAYCKAEKRDKS